MWCVCARIWRTAIKHWPHTYLSIYTAVANVSQACGVSVCNNGCSFVVLSCKKPLSVKFCTFFQVFFFLVGWRGLWTESGFQHAWLLLSGSWRSGWRQNWATEQRPLRRSAALIRKTVLLCLNYSWIQMNKAKRETHHIPWWVPHQLGTSGTISIL